MLQIVPAVGDLQMAALMLLYCRLPRGERERQLASLLESVSRNEITLDHLLIAIRDGAPVGAILVVIRPGRMAFLFPPAVRPAEEGTLVAEQLLKEAAARVDAAGVVVTQCLLDPDDCHARDLLNACSFPYGTDILLLSRELDELPEAAQQVELSIVAYEPSREAEFVAVVERTYVDSLDCPDIARFRRASDALTSYRAAPGFDPALWRLGRVDEGAVGVLLAHDHPERSVREIVYLGIVPEARRRGIASALLRLSLQAAADAGIRSCEVAVDSGNHYALNLYRSLAFEEERRFAVHLRLRRGT